MCTTSQILLDILKRLKLYSPSKFYRGDTIKPEKKQKQNIFRGRIHHLHYHIS